MTSHLIRVFVRSGVIGVCVALAMGTLGCGDPSPPEIPEPPMGEMPKNENPKAEKKSTKKKRKKGRDPSDPLGDPSVIDSSP